MGAHARILLLFALLAAPTVRAAEPPALVTMAVGQNTATSAAGAMRILAKGDAVYPKEVLATGPNSYLNVRMSDGSFVLLRPASRFVIEDYRYTARTTVAPVQTPAAAGAPQNRALMRLLRGGFRAVSGAIGHSDPDAYRVNTPVATIGIRGTDYVAVICDAACALDPVIAENLPPGAAAEDSLLAGVVEGAIVLTGNEGGAQTDVLRDHFVLSLRGGRVAPLPAEPRFLRVDPIPNPRICQ